MSRSSLLSTGFSAEQQTYIGWLATPSILRSPETETLLAQELGIPLATLDGWRRLPALMAAVRKGAVEALGERYADVIRSIEERAIAGSIQHQRLYLQLFGVDSTGVEEIGPNIKVLVGVDLALVGNSTVAVSRE
jgi:hypothetical protein